MTIEIGLVLAILAAAIVLFFSERLRADVVALLVLVTLALTGLITSRQVFSGFSSPAVVTVVAVFVLSDGLIRTGIVDIIGHRLKRVAGNSEVGLIVGLMVLCGVMSAFMNNIAATAILMPAAIRVGRQAKIPISKLLIPLSFSSLLGGNMTLIGTPPNILASDILREQNPELAFAFFDFLPLGIMVLTIGVVYMVLIGRHLLPSRHGEEDLAELYELPMSLTEVRVRPDSPLVGQTINEAGLGQGYNVTVARISRPEHTRPAPVPERYLGADDVLLVTGGAEAIEALVRDKRLDIVPAERRYTQATLERGDQMLAEATISPRSKLTGQTLREIGFRNRYHVTVLTIWRRDHALQSGLADIPLQSGDVLLLQGTFSHLKLLDKDPNFLLLNSEFQAPRRAGLAPLAVLIMLGVVLSATFNLVHISVAGMIGAVLMVVIGIVPVGEMYRAVQWRSIFLIASMLPLGIAMEQTGTAQFLADNMIALVGGFGPLAILAGIFILAMLLTGVMSNAAATVVIAPIAIDAALTLGADPRSFVLAIVIAASTSFITPIGHQANILVMSAGSYRFLDYTRVGVGLNVLIFIATMLMLPVVWPLFPA